MLQARIMRPTWHKRVAENIPSEKSLTRRKKGTHLLKNIVLGFYIDIDMFLQIGLKAQTTHIH